MAITTTTQTFVTVDDPLPPHMYVRTVTLRHKETGALAVVNVGWETAGDLDPSLYEVTDAKSAVPASPAPAPAVQGNYSAEDLAVLGSKELARIAASVGVDTNGKTKNAIVSEIVAKQAP